jgi:hypothetical protein
MKLQVGQIKVLQVSFYFSIAHIREPEGSHTVWVADHCSCCSELLCIVGCPLPTTNHNSRNSSSTTHIVAPRPAASGTSTGPCPVYPAPSQQLAASAQQQQVSTGGSADVPASTAAEVLHQSAIDLTGWMLADWMNCECRSCSPFHGAPAAVCWLRSSPAANNWVPWAVPASQARESYQACDHCRW